MPEAEKPKRPRKTKKEVFALRKQQHIENFNLVPKEENQPSPPTYRRSGFAEDVTIFDQEKNVARNLFAIRKKSGLSAKHMADFLDISHLTYGRYERRDHPMTLGTLFKICELLNFKPIEIIGRAAPQLFGKTQKEADLNLTLFEIIVKLPLTEREGLFSLLNKVETPPREAPIDPEVTSDES